MQKAHQRTYYGVPAVVAARQDAPAELADSAGAEARRAPAVPLIGAVGAGDLPEHPVEDVANARMEIFWDFGAEAMEVFTREYQSMSNADFARVMANGDFARAMANADFARAMSNGDFARAMANGDFARSAER